MESLTSAGVDTLIEIGPGNVLSGLAKRAMTGVTSAQLSSSIEELVTEAVDSGDLVTTITTLASSEGNTVLTAVSASVIVSTTYTSTKVDTVTGAPTAVYENCPPLYMTPNELAYYMDAVLCEEDTLEKHGTVSQIG